jgi:hypothetical protein
MTSTLNSADWHRRDRVLYKLPAEPSDAPVLPDPTHATVSADLRALAHRCADAGKPHMARLLATTADFIRVGEERAAFGLMLSYHGVMVSNAAFYRDVTEGEGV